MKSLFRIAGIGGLLLSGSIVVTQLQGCAVGIVAAGGAGAAMAMDRRSAGTIVDDEAIELKISKGISDDDELGDKAHINITSYDYVVLLTGETPTAAMRDRAVNIARHTVKVLKVYDEIAVAKPTTMKSRSNDTWITGNVKAKLLQAKDVNAAQVKIVTEKRTVYLMGLVTHAEAKAAIQVARFVEDVARVVPLFEYID